jgi:hypothetical protein
MGKRPSRRRRARSIKGPKQDDNDLKLTERKRSFVKMKSKEKASSREPSHTPNFTRVALIVFAVVLLLSAVAMLVAYAKFLRLK